MAKKNYGRGKGKDDPRKAPKDAKPTTTPEEQDAARAALEERLRQKAAKSRANEDDVRSSSKAKDVAPTPKVTTTKPSDPKPVLSTEERMQAEVKAEDFQPKDVIGGEASPSTTAQVAGEMTPGVDVEAVKKLSAGGGSDPLRPKSIDPDFEEVSEEEVEPSLPDDGTYPEPFATPEEIENYQIEQDIQEVSEVPVVNEETFGDNFDIINSPVIEKFNIEESKPETIVMTSDFETEDVDNDFWRQHVIPDEEEDLKKNS
jgi:hypothetical protein